MSEPKGEWRDGFTKCGMTPLECILLLDKHLPGRNFTLAPDLFDCLHGDLQSARNADGVWKAGVVDGRQTLLLVKDGLDIRVTRGEGK